MYSPPEVELRSIADFAEWPDLGRVGFCAKGRDFSRSFLLVIREAPNLYGIAARSLKVGEHSFDTADIVDGPDLVLQLLQENPVRWCPSELDSLVERRVFGLRASVARALLRQGKVATFLKFHSFARATESVRARALVWPDEHDIELSAR